MEERKAKKKRKILNFCKFVKKTSKRKSRIRCNESVKITTENYFGNSK